MTRSRYKFGEPHRAHFLTCTIAGWLPVFTRPETVNIVLDSFRFLQANNRMTLYAYVILENHLHMIAAAADLSEQVQRFKSYTARRIIDHLKDHNVSTLLRWFQMLKADWKGESEYQLWEQGSHPQEIETDDMMEQKLDYLHMNPVKRGYVDDPTHWRYSSARNYAGMEGLIPVTAWR
jgi:REP element-mobilizing transposase RayT